MNDENKTKGTEKEKAELISLFEIITPKKFIIKNKCPSSKHFIMKIKTILIVMIIFFIIIYLKSKSKFLSLPNDYLNEFIIDTEFYNYERNLITEDMKKYAQWEQIGNEPYFINGIIRKFKPKNCLEIGVSKGGGSIIILNAIKDMNDSTLISLDINERVYNNPREKTGCNVKKYFPYLAENNKWKLYTGKQPHIFLERLNIQFDFLFLDTVHLAPGEIINFIEVLPFLKENAIVILHDVMFHIPSLNHYNPPEIKYHPSVIYLMTSIEGKKMMMKHNKIGFENIGAVILKKNQEKYFLNYFLLLMSPWNYMPSDANIEELKIFIKKYYKRKIYLDIFDIAVLENKLYINKLETLKKSSIINKSDSKHL